MPDLRALTLDERYALAREAERRARAGEAPKDIRVAMGLTKKTYSRWAKLFGFRQCDLFPDAPRGGGPAKHPPGPGGYADSGRRFQGLPLAPDDPRFVYGPAHPAWRGGEAAWRQRDLDKRRQRRTAMEQELADLGTAEALQTAVLTALEAGDTARADQLLAAWQRDQRRDRALEALEKAVAFEKRPKSSDEMTDEEVCAELERMLGRPFRVEPDDEDDAL